MQFPASVKPAGWGAVAGAIAMTIAGFWGLGWTTASTTERIARERADAAVVATLVPLCVAKAQQDGDAAKLVKFRAEQSPYSRSELVREAGWATLLGMTTPDYALASACAEKLQASKVS
jgi:hypothetical protein